MEALQRYGAYVVANCCQPTFIAFVLIRWNRQSLLHELNYCVLKLKDYKFFFCASKYSLLDTSVVLVVEVVHSELILTLHCTCIWPTFGQESKSVMIRVGRVGVWEKEKDIQNILVS